MIIYSDQDILAVNKRPGEFIQSSDKETLCLVERLEKEYGRLYIVHRLDTPASGIIVFARNKASAAELNRQFSSRTVEKKYLCAVDSPPPEEEGRLKNYIITGSGKNKNKVFIRKSPDKNTKEAVLDYRLIYKTEHYHILEIKLITGRKHQIRAQLAAAGCHIKGDIKYGARRTNPGGGIHLHAASLRIKLPAGRGKPEKELTLCAPLPDDPVWNSVPAAVLSDADFQQQN